MIRKIKIELRLADIEALADYMRGAEKALTAEARRVPSGNRRGVLLHAQMAALLWQKFYKKYGGALAKGKQEDEPVKLTLTYPEAYFLEIILLMDGIPFERGYIGNELIAQIDKQII